MERQTDIDAKIYRAYAKNKGLLKNDRKTINDLAFSLRISRTRLYDVIWRVEHGNPVAAKREADAARLDSLWHNKFKPRFMSLPKNRELYGRTIRVLIGEMLRSGYSQRGVANRLKKARSTIIHHIKH